MNAAIVFLLAFAAPALSASYNQWAAAPATIVLSQDGQNILDTPEVANARAAHIAALQQAQAAVGHSNGPVDDGSYDSRWEQDSYDTPQQQQWSPASPQQQQQQWNAAPAQSWKNGPQANIALSADGQHVLDTADVANARAAHLAAHAALQAQAAAAPKTQWNDAAAQQQWSAPAPAQQQWSAPAQQYSGAAPQQWNAPAPASQQWNAPAPAHQQWNAPAPAPQQWNAPAPAPQQWNAPAPAPQWNGAPSWQAAPAQNKWANAPSQIHLSQDGANVLDTPEVAAARAAHIAAHAAASAQAAPAPARHW